LRTRPAFQQRRKPDLAIARIVVDDGEVARAACDQGVDQFGGHPGGTEAPDHDGRAVEDIGDSGCGRCNCLVDHCSPSFVQCAITALLFD
jgi:hypothetical protein